MPVRTSPKTRRRGEAQRSARVFRRQAKAGRAAGSPSGAVGGRGGALAPSVARLRKPVPAKAKPKGRNRSAPWRRAKPERPSARVSALEARAARAKGHDRGRASVPASAGAAARAVPPLVKYVVERLASACPRTWINGPAFGRRARSARRLRQVDAGKAQVRDLPVWRIKGAVLDQLRALDWARARPPKRATGGIVHAPSRPALGRQASGRRSRARRRSARDITAYGPVRARVLSLDEVRPEAAIRLVWRTDRDPRRDVRPRSRKRRGRSSSNADQLPEQERSCPAYYYET